MRADRGGRPYKDFYFRLLCKVWVRSRARSGIRSSTCRQHMRFPCSITRFPYGLPNCLISMLRYLLRLFLNFQAEVAAVAAAAQCCGAAPRPSAGRFAAFHRPRCPAGSGAANATAFPCCLGRVLPAARTSVDARQRRRSAARPARGSAVRRFSEI